MYTAKERVERNGFLVAYEGETMSDTEAARRGLIDGCADDSADVFRVGTSDAEEQTAVVEPPIDEVWADAAGMSVEECIELWNEDPNAVLDAIKANLSQEAENDQTAVVEPPIDGKTDNAADDNDSDADKAKPSKAELREECEKRGIKAPKNATIAQLEALLGD